MARGGAHKYQHVAVQDIEDDITAAGMRHGCINTVQTLHPLELCLHATGQDGGSHESVFRSHYGGCNKQACLTVGATLVGHDKVGDWSSLRHGPFPPDLACLVELGVDMQQLDVVVDKLMHLHSAANPDFRQHGRLRPLVLTCFATMLMYYPERVVLSPGGGVQMPEMARVSLKMQESLRKNYSKSAGGMANGGSPDLTFRYWAQHIRAKFSRDNLPVLKPTAGFEIAGYTQATQLLGKTVGNLASGVTAIGTEMRHMNEQHRHENIALHVQNDRLKQALLQKDEVIAHLHADLMKKNNMLARQGVTSTSDSSGVDLMATVTPGPPAPLLTVCVSGTFVCSRARALSLLCATSLSRILRAHARAPSRSFLRVISV